MKYDDNSIYRAELKVNIGDNFSKDTIAFIEYSSNMDIFKILNYEYYINPEDVEVLQEFKLK